MPSDDAIIGYIVGTEAVMFVLTLTLIDLSHRLREDRKRGYNDSRKTLSFDHVWYLVVFLLSILLLVCNMVIHYSEMERLWAFIVSTLLALFFVLDWVLTRLDTAVFKFSPDSAFGLGCAVIGSILVILNQIWFYYHFAQGLKPDERPYHQHYDRYIFILVTIFLGVDLVLEIQYIKDAHFISFHESSVCAGLPGFLWHFTKLMVRIVWMFTKWCFGLSCIVCVLIQEDYRISPFWNVLLPLFLQLWNFCLFCRRPINRPIPRGILRTYWRKITQYFFNIALKDYKLNHPRHPVPCDTWEAIDRFNECRVDKQKTKEEKMKQVSDQSQDDKV